MKICKGPSATTPRTSGNVRGVVTHLQSHCCQSCELLRGVPVQVLIQTFVYTCPQEAKFGARFSMQVTIIYITSLIQ